MCKCLRCVNLKLNSSISKRVYGLIIIKGGKDSYRKKLLIISIPKATLTKFHNY